MSPSNANRPTSKADCASRDDTSSDVSPPNIREDDYDAALESWLNLCLDDDRVETQPAASSASHKLSKGSETILLGQCRDSGALEDASSVTLRDERTWHDSGVSKSAQKIPRTIVSALLQGVSDVSPPSRGALGRAGREAHEADEHSDSEDVSPRSSTRRKGKWKARPDDDLARDSPSDREESPQFEFPSLHNSVEEWVIHNRPVLQDYADRQVSLPLGQRLEVSIEEPSQFILGALQLLVNRDQSDRTDYSRRLGPQLIENFVDISRWTNEYFRSRHGTHVADTDVSTLFTIILNNFYEGQVQLIDRLVEFALGNMRLGGRSSLKLADFAFGFDFRMSQDLPFYVETGAQFRKPRPVRAVEVRSPLEPVTTSSGRRVKPTKRAQESAAQSQKHAGGRRNDDDSVHKGKHAAQVPGARNKPTADDPVPAVPLEKRSLGQPSTGCIVPNVSQIATAAVAAPSPKASAVPSGAPPVPGTTPSQSNDDTRSQPGKSAAGDARRVPGSSGSNLELKCGSPPPRLKIRLPPNGTASTTAIAIAPATSDSETTAWSDLEKSAPAAVDASGSVAPSWGQQDIPSSSTRTRARGGPRGGRRGYSACRARGHGHGRGCRRGAGTPTSAHADNVFPMAAPTGDTAEAVTVLPAAVDVPVAPPTAEHTHAPLSTGTSSGKPHGANNGIERYLTLRLNKTDPGHLQAKKRKLDD